MRQLRLIVVAILVILPLSGVISAEPLNFDFKTGLGYDFISHQYYYDSLLVDSLEASLATKTTFLDDVRGQFTVRMYRDDLELQSSLEQSSETARLKFQFNNDIALNKNKLSLMAEFDWRKYYEADEEAGDSYFFGDFRADLKVPSSDKLDFYGQIRGDFVNFNITGDYIYNNYRLGGKTGLSLDIGDFSFFDADLFYLHREVADSNSLNYNNYGLEGTFMGLGINHEIDVFYRLERKDYNKTSGTDDYTRLDVNENQKLRVGEATSFRQELEYEMAYFNEQDLINNDYYRIGFNVQIGLEGDFWGIWIGPDVEYLDEQDNGDTGIQQGYFELGAKFDLDYMNAGSFFGTLESILGHRKMDYTDEFQSNFIYERLNLIVDWKFYGDLNLNVMFSSEWEWHDIKDDNNQIYLLSSGIYYSF